MKILIDNRREGIMVIRSRYHRKSNQRPRSIAVATLEDPKATFRSGFEELTKLDANIKSSGQ